MDGEANIADLECQMLGWVLRGIGRNQCRSSYSDQSSFLMRSQARASSSLRVQGLSSYSASTTHSSLRGMDRIPRSRHIRVDGTAAPPRHVGRKALQPGCAVAAFDVPQVVTCFVLSERTD